MDNGNGASFEAGDDVDTSVVWFWFDRIKDGHCLVLSVIFWQPMCTWCANASSKASSRCIIH